MSQENVERLRKGFEAYARGDLDEALAGLDPDVVYIADPGSAGPRPRCGSGLFGTLGR